MGSRAAGCIQGNEIANIQVKWNRGHQHRNEPGENMETEDVVRRQTLRNRREVALQHQTDKLEWKLTPTRKLFQLTFTRQKHPTPYYLLIVFGSQDVVIRSLKKRCNLNSLHWKSHTSFCLNRTISHCYHRKSFQDKEDFHGISVSGGTFPFRLVW